MPWWLMTSACRSQNTENGLPDFINFINIRIHGSGCCFTDSISPSAPFFSKSIDCWYLAILFSFRSKVCLIFGIKKVQTNSFILYFFWCQFRLFGSGRIFDHFFRVWRINLILKLAFQCGLAQTSWWVVRHSVPRVVIELIRLNPVKGRSIAKLPIENCHTLTLTTALAS